jgi:hypothetical protein
VTETDGEQTAAYRYGGVFLLTVMLLVFIIVAPSAAWSRAVAITLESAALVVAFATSHAREEVRRARATAAGVAAVVVILGVATGLFSPAVTFAIGGILAVAVPLSLVRGLLRMVTTQGVSIRGVAGGLSIYLLVGLGFAWIVGFIAEVGSTPYFAQGTNGNTGDWAYYSFVVLTTTGFGDFTPATRAGHAVAVIEMLVGQLYLVTIIGVLVGNLAHRRSPVGD